MDPKIIPPKALACGPGQPLESAAGNCSITLIQVFCIWTIITNIIIINKYVFLINYKTQIMTLMKVICLTECVIGLVMWTGLDFASELYPNTGICNSNSKFGMSNSRFGYATLKKLPHWDALRLKWIESKQKKVRTERQKGGGHGWARRWG